MRRAIVALAAAAVFTAFGLALLSPLTAADEAPVKFDVNDVSFLFPVPKTPADVKNLIGVDELLADGKTTILPDSALKAVLALAKAAKVVGSNGRTARISIPDEFGTLSTWKVAGVRVDPSAVGTAPMLVKAMGSVPQVRLVIQPVTVKDGKVRVHDVAAHLVFNYVLPKDKVAAVEGTIALPRADKEKFGAIVKGLSSLKASLKEAGVTTGGKLGVHPGLLGDKGPGFAGEVKSFLKAHLHGDRLVPIAFMGIDAVEPWLFVATVKGSDGKFKALTNKSFANDKELTQMLTARDGVAVMPAPTPTNVAKDRGVSTALLFPAPGADDVDLDKAVFADVPGLKHRDIPDYIANPIRTHFFNTDCVSCHTESSRRKELGIDKASKFAFERPVGVSGVDEAVLPTEFWNVHNFGWFPSFFARATVPTVTMRTANEAAESADFINREYLARKK